MSKEIAKHYELPEVVVTGKKPLRYVMKPEDLLDFIGALTGPLFSFLSPTQVIRKVYDVSKSIRNKEGIDKIGKALFQTNSGIVTKKFEKEHPISSALINLVGDAAIPAGLLGTAKGINYLARMDMPRFGFKPSTNYLFASGYAGANGNKIVKTKETLSQALKDKGWRLEGNVYIDPKGNLFIRNSEGRLLSIKSITETLKALIIHQKNIVEPQLIKKKQEKLIKEAIQDFENVGILGFRTKSWKAFRKGFNTTLKDIEEYESHIPEYWKIFKDLYKKGELSNVSGHWEGLINGKMVPVNARLYIISRHPNFINNGWKYDGINRGTSMFPETAPMLKNNGGLDAANWTTNSSELLGIFSHLRNDGPTIRGIVSTKTEPDRIIPVKHAHEARLEKYPGITDFEGPVGLANNPEIKGTWRIYGPDMRIKAIDGNTGLFDKAVKSPLSGIIPPILLGAYYNYE